MNADLLIQALLEAVEVGDDGVWLKPSSEPKERRGTYIHNFQIIHPVHGIVGSLKGIHRPKTDDFEITVVDLMRHPKYRPQNNRSLGEPYEGASRTLIRAGLKSLMKQIPGLKRIKGYTRTTGTHRIAAERFNNPVKNSDTSVVIPKSMRT